MDFFRCEEFARKMGRYYICGSVSLRERMQILSEFQETWDLLSSIQKVCLWYHGGSEGFRIIRFLQSSSSFVSFL